MIEIQGAVKSFDNMMAHYIATDPKASFTVLSPEAPENYRPQDVDWVDPQKVDYDLPMTTSDAVALPMSYLQIKRSTPKSRCLRRTLFLF